MGGWLVEGETKAGWTVMFEQVTLGRWDRLMSDKINCLQSYLSFFFFIKWGEM